MSADREQAFGIGDAAAAELVNVAAQCRSIGVVIGRFWRRWHDKSRLEPPPFRIALSPRPGPGAVCSKIQIVTSRRTLETRVVVVVMVPGDVTSTRRPEPSRATRRFGNGVDAFMREEQHGRRFAVNASLPVDDGQRGG
ncbi:MAG: hypothetical protein R3F22_09155 [Lysobacteraceae bacterium]